MRQIFSPIAFALTAAALLAVPAAAQTKEFKLTISAGQHDRRNTPVEVPLALPKGLGPGSFVELKLNGQPIPGQLIRPSLLSPAEPALTGSELAGVLVFVLPQLKAGETATVEGRISIDGEPEKKLFSWNDTPAKHTELRFDGRPVLRYMYAPLDESSKEARHATMKPFHHVFDPAGKQLVTKGPGGLFPHHRGLFFGFNKITYGDKKQADTWHCNQGEFTAHQGFAASENGPVLGRHVARIHWYGREADLFATELREMTAYNVPGGTLIEFASRLSSTVGKVQLDGDPQHAGFQFRASQEVPDKTKAKTYYLRPDGKGEPGKFRNWPADKNHVNLPWNALSFVQGDQRYTCCYIDRPENPKEARFSERDYGRFGSYFEYELDTDRPLELNYRIWLQEGEMDVAGVQQIADDFVEPVEVRVE